MFGSGVVRKTARGMDTAAGAPMEGVTAFLRTTPDPDMAAALSVAALGGARIRDRTGTDAARNDAPQLSGAPKAQ